MSVNKKCYSLTVTSNILCLHFMLLLIILQVLTGNTQSLLADYNKHSRGTVKEEYLVIIIG